MATSQLLTDTKKFDEMIVDVITDLRRKYKRADCESIDKEIVKIADFSEKILNKRNRNLDSYYINENTSPDNKNLQKHPIITFHLIFPLAIQNQFSLLLRKRHQKLGRDQHQLILFLILLSGLHLQTVKVQT